MSAVGENAASESLGAAVDHLGTQYLGMEKTMLPFAIFFFCVVLALVVALIVWIVQKWRANDKK